MTAILIVLLIQAVLGAADNLIHHELQARLAARPSARRELALHASREAIYGVVFLALAWTQPMGLWVWLLAGLLVVEVAITAADFLEEDRTRRLPPAERVLHLVLTVSYGIFLAMLAPQLWHWVGQETALLGTGYGILSWLLTLSAVGVIAWSARNWVAVIRLRPAATAAAHPERVAEAKTVLVTGGTGFIGSALVRQLAGEGHRVLVLTRDVRQARAQFGGRVVAVDRLDDLPAETRIDAVVNLAGAAIFGLPWTRRRRRTLLESRTTVTEAVNRLIARLAHKPAVMVSASAVGFYGHGDAQPLDETAPPQPIFSSELCRQREAVAAVAERWGVRCVHLRFGLVLHDSGGVLPPMALAGRFGCGAVLGRGDQPMPWIHLDDALGLIRFAVACAELSGPVNATAPETPTQAGFAAALARAQRRPLWLRIPAPLLQRLLGAQAELLLRGRVVRPARALAAGYRFRHPEIAPALAEILRGTPRDGERGDAPASLEPKQRGGVLP